MNRDRYFQLGADLEASFLSVIEGHSAPTLAVSALTERGILCLKDGYEVRQQVELPVPSRAADALKGETTLGETLRALLAETRIRKRLDRQGLASVISSLRSEKARAVTASIDHPMSAGTIRAFELAKLIRTPANRCLSRSIALVQRLAAHGCAAHLVMGVRVIPFAAHSWAQIGDVVLNDSPEEVARFTPILVL
ncbi:lasso peptide biosynthesis B2 protein [Novosphingobium clariflavum]